MTDDEKKLLKDCATMLPWLMDWAEAWHRQAGGYTASDTEIGLGKCWRLIERLKKWEAAFASAQSPAGPPDTAGGQRP